MMGRRWKALWVAAVCGGMLLAAGVPARAEVGFEVAPRIGSMRGDSTYRIGGFFSGPGESGYTMDRLSELEFPLDVGMAGIGGGLRFGVPYVTAGRARFGGALHLDAEYARSFTDDAGKMEDSDWTEPGAPSYRTIYSTSDAELDAESWELRALFHPLEMRSPFFGWRIGIGAGFLRQNFDYDVSNVVQRSVYPEFNGSFRGKVLTYEVTYEVPYVGLAAAVSIGEGRAVSGSLEARLGYSAWAQAEDRDDHLLRAKLSEGSADGDAVLFSLRGRITLFRHLFVTAGFSSVSIETDGTQTQTRYAETEEGPRGLIGTIETEIFSDQTLFDFAVGASF